MKRPFTLLFILALCCNVNFVVAQDWLDAYDKGMALFEQANIIGRGKTELTEAEHKEKLKLYKQAAEKFILARDNSRKLDAQSTYFIATSLYYASLQETALGDDLKAFKTIKRAISYWPDLDVVPAQKFTTGKVIRAKEGKKAYSALGSSTDWQHSYFRSYVRAMQLSNALKMYDTAIDYAEFILDEADTLDNENFIAWAELSESYKYKEDYCRSTTYAMRALENATKFEFNYATDKEQLKYYLPILAVNVAPRNDCRYDPVKWSERAALALSTVQDIDDQSFYVLLYGQDAYNKGRKNNRLLISLAEAEYYQSKRGGEKPGNDKTNWNEKLEEQKKELNSDELKRLARLYELKGNTQEKEITEKKAKRKAYWEKTHFAISTNPANLYNGNTMGPQYLVAFDFMLPRQSHEVRVCYNTSSMHLLWKNPGDPYRPSIFFMYTGYELSYTLKFVEKDKKGVKSKNFYTGPQIRYENRKYYDVFANVAPLNDPESAVKREFFDISSNRYELMMMLGMQNRSKWFFVDYFFGVGGGYKTFPKNSELIGANEEFKDDRFRETRWNKFYVPVHTGIRVGLILK